LLPLNGVPSKSSRFVRTANSCPTSGRSMIMLVSPAEKRNPSSWNFKMYSPSKAGTTASEVLPANALTRSTEPANVPDPSVLLECLT